jgi:hypothetical protein
LSPAGRPAIPQEDKTVFREIPAIYIAAVDFVSHALWGGVAFGRKNKRNFALAAGVSILPDILTEGLFGVLLVLGIGGMPGWEHGHPNISDYPMFAQNLYNVTHSLLVFAAVFGLIWAAGAVGRVRPRTRLNRWPLWMVAPWGLHILIDIPTHSMALFPTPFLWPISSFKLNGIGWDHPAVFAIDITLLITAYSVWLLPKLHRKR